MKINVYCNDYFMSYNSVQMAKESVINLRTGYIKSIANDTDTFILRGEPTYHYDFNAILNAFPSRNYILTTHANNTDAIISYPGTIPYVSFQWDGFLNDSLKGFSSQTNEMVRALNYLANKNTIVRIAYTISPCNIDHLDADLAIMRKFMSRYPKMKQPYFMLYQQGRFYSQDDFVWTNISLEQINSINRSGLLTAKNYNYLLAWFAHDSFQCISPRDEITVMNDATVRMCQSYGIDKVIGDLSSNTLSEIVSATELEREEMINCKYKDRCWIAFHHKDNINVQND